MKETKYKDMVFVNNELVSYGSAKSINIGMCIIVISLVTPFSNWFLVPLGLKLRKRRVIVRYEKKRLK